MTNQELVNIITTYNEIAGAIEAKKQIKDVGKVIYAMTKKRKEITGVFNVLVEDEKILNESFTEAMKEPGSDKESLTKQYQADHKNLFEKEINLEPYKFSLENAEILSVHLGGLATTTLFDLLTYE